VLEKYIKTNLTVYSTWMYLGFIWRQECTWLQDHPVTHMARPQNLETICTLFFLYLSSSSHPGQELTALPGQLNHFWLFIFGGGTLKTLTSFHGIRNLGLLNAKSKLKGEVELISSMSCICSDNLMGTSKHRGSCFTNETILANIGVCLTCRLSASYRNCLLMMEGNNSMFHMKLLVDQLILHCI
jgi:hypothetical protein